MNGDMTVEALRAVPLFADLDDEAIDRIARELAEFEVPRGHVLIEPGREATGLFLIGEGTVVVERDGERIQLGPGESVGELALLAPSGVRSARVQAATEVRGWAVSRDRFEKMIESEPRIALALLRILAARLGGS